MLRREGSFFVASSTLASAIYVVAILPSPSHKEDLMAAKKTSKSTSKKYSNGASRKVAKAMHERKQGTLESGGSGKKVTSRKQAIAIGLSEARREGEKVPKPKRGSSSSRGKKPSRGAK
jgi:hypothetical protein